MVHTRAWRPPLVRSRAEALAAMPWREGLRTAICSALVRALACYVALTATALVAPGGDAPPTTPGVATYACSTPGAADDGGAAHPRPDSPCTLRR